MLIIILIIRRKWVYIGKYNIIVKDKYGNILTPEQLKEKVIDNEQFYLNMELIKKRLNIFRQGTKD